MIPIEILMVLAIQAAPAPDGPPRALSHLRVVAAPAHGLFDAGILYPHAIVDGQTEDGRTVRLFLPMMSHDEPIPAVDAVCDFEVHSASMDTRNPFGGDYQPRPGAFGLIIDHFSCRPADDSKG